MDRLWRQLVVTMNAFSARCVDQQNFTLALSLLNKASELAENDRLFTRPVSLALRAFLFDNYAYFYFKRKKAEASLNYVQKALKIHLRLDEWSHVAKCQLHCGAALSRLKRHDEAIRCNAQVLALVESGKLEVGGTQPQKLCMVAVCYHNIATQQIALRLVAEACVSAQNARRIARLCLSYSTRFLKHFDYTHQTALEQLTGLANDKDNEDAKRLFKRLLNQL